MQNFVSFAASVAELAHWRNIAYSVITHPITQSITQSPSLFDGPRTEALASE